MTATIIKTVCVLILGIASFVPLSSCGVLSPQQQSTSLQIAKGLLDSGQITQKQYDGLVDTITQGGATPLWQQAAGLLLTGLLTYLGIMKARGPVGGTPARALVDAAGDAAAKIA